MEAGIVDANGSLTEHYRPPMYTHRPNLILAFHGCDLEDRYNLLLGRTDPKASENEYDWLE
jgi:hypothetical protein